jgi:hypothetical protein
MEQMKKEKYLERILKEDPQLLTQFAAKVAEQEKEALLVKVKQQEESRDQVIKDIKKGEYFIMHSPTLNAARPILLKCLIPADECKKGGSAVKMVVLELNFSSINDNPRIFERFFNTDNVMHNTLIKIPSNKIPKQVAKIFDEMEDILNRLGVESIKQKLAKIQVYK